MIRTKGIKKYNSGLNLEQNNSEISCLPLGGASNNYCITSIGPASAQAELSVDFFRLTFILVFLKRDRMVILGITHQLL